MDKTDEAIRNEIFKKLNEYRTIDTSKFTPNDLQDKLLEALTYIQNIQDINLATGESSYKDQYINNLVGHTMRIIVPLLTKPFTDIALGIIEDINYKINITSNSRILYIPEFSEQYKLTKESPLIKAISTYNEPAIIAELKKIPPTYIKYVGTCSYFLLHLLTTNLLVGPIQYLADKDIPFEQLYNQLSKRERLEDIGRLPADLLQTAKGSSKKKLEIIKIYNKKDVLRYHNRYTRAELSLLGAKLGRRLVVMERLRRQHYITRRNFSHRDQAFPAAYYILGHGGNYNDQQTILVPINCAVIAKAFVGQNTYIFEENIPLYDYNQEVYINPFKKSNLLYLVDKYRYLAMFGEKTYVPNFSYTLFSYFLQNDNTYRFSYSGIIKYPFRARDKNIDEIAKWHTTQISKDALLRDHVNTIVDLFKFSIYPTSDVVKTYLDGLKNTHPNLTIHDTIQNHIQINELFNRSQEKLFLNLDPGVFYNFICRANRYTNELYTNGYIIDDSMKNAIIKSDEKTLAARKGLQAILAEAVGTRAGMMRRRYNNNTVSNISSDNLNVDMDTRIKFRKIREDIQRLNSNFSAAGMIELCIYLITNVKIFTDNNDSIKGIIQYIEMYVPRLLERLEPTEEHIHKVIDLYNAFDHTNNKVNIFKQYPSYLEEYNVTSNDITKMSEKEIQTKYKDMPDYKLLFIHDFETKYTLMMNLIQYVVLPFSLIKTFYNKEPKLVRIVHYKNAKHISFYTSVLLKYLSIATKSKPRPYYIEFDGKIRTIIEKEKNTMDAPYLRAELADPKYQHKIIYKIFEPYINEHKLYIMFPTIRDGMLKFGMKLPATASSSRTRGGGRHKTMRKNRK